MANKQTLSEYLESMSSSAEKEKEPQELQAELAKKLHGLKHAADEQRKRMKGEAEEEQEQREHFERQFDDT
jgi:septal ring factor EnvC (AmiA/AmiB activator)